MENPRIPRDMSITERFKMEFIYLYHSSSGKDRDSSMINHQDGALTRGVKKSIQLEIPPHMVPLVLGRGGETLKNIEMSCNAVIQLSERNYDEPSKPRIATIVGEEVSIQAAK